MTAWLTSVQHRLAVVAGLCLLADAIIGLSIVLGFLTISMGTGLMVLLGVAVVILGARLRAKPM